MRLTIAVTVAGLCCSQVAGAAQDTLPPADPPEPLIAQITSMLPAKVGIDGERLIFVSAGVVFVALVMNFVSGGMIGALFGVGRASTVPAATLATFALTEIAWHATVWGLGPATVLSIGQPIDAALRDGYTTPSTLAAAFGETGRRAEGIVTKAGTLVGGTVESWWQTGSDAVADWSRKN